MVLIIPVPKLFSRQKLSCDKFLRIILVKQLGQHRKPNVGDKEQIEVFICFMNHHGSKSLIKSYKVFLISVVIIAVLIKMSEYS